MGGCTKSTWISMFVLNIAMLLAALSLIAVGFWMRYDESFDSDLKSVVYRTDDVKSLADAKFNVRVWLIVVFWSIVGLAIGAAATGTIGIVCSVLKRARLTATFLVLLVTLIVLEFGSAIALLIYRNQLHTTLNTLVAAMYSSNARADLQIIQSKYSCCGTQDGALNRLYCSTDEMPTCDVAVVDSVDNTMMIAGIVFLVVLVLQLILAVLPVPLMIRGSTSKHRFVSTHIDHF